VNGFINLIKPTGMTSSFAVIKARRILNEKKIGHLGTLDPLAAGVLPLAVGKGTKLFDYLIEKQKTYTAFFTFGLTTDTLDSDGVVTERKPFNGSAADVENVIRKFTGKLHQMPPKYSAKSVGGVRAYDLARQGKEFELKTKQVEVLSFDLKRQIDAYTFCFEIVCSAGTYIRSLARDVAEKLGTAGYMSALIRTKSGLFTLDNAYTLDELEQLKGAALLPLTLPLDDLPVFEVEQSLLNRLNNGVKIEWTPTEKGYHRIMCGGVFFGIGKEKEEKLDLQFYLK
jgi:tRNA pseudouridine55 synthase